MLFRYILLLQIHQNKKKIIQQFKENIQKDSTKFGKQTEKLKKILSFILKISSSHWIVLIFPLIWLSIFEFLQFGVIAYHGFKCTESANSLQRLVHTAFIGIVFILIISTLIFDFLCNIPLIFICQWKKIFVKNDPYNYRLDMIAFLFLIPITIVWVGVNLPAYPFSLVVEIIMILGLWTSGLQALIITIIKLIHYSSIKKKIDKQNNNNNNNILPTIESILKPRMLECFIEYCESEWSSENIYLKLDILEYQKTKSKQEREDLCWIIKERYLLVNVSPLEINCPSLVLSRTLKMIGEKKFGDDLFKEIEVNVDMNLMDTISRFKYSTLYSLQLKDAELESKILGL